MSEQTEIGRRKLLRDAVSIGITLRERGEKDPLKHYVSNPGGQTSFIECVLNRDKRDVWFLAANRSGKSDAGAVCGAVKARYGDQTDGVKWIRSKGSSVEVRDRATSGWVVSLDFPSSRDIIQPKYFDNGFVPAGATHDPFIPEWEIDEWRISDQILKLKNGSIIGFKSGDSGRKKFQGAEKDWVHFDEEPDEDIYKETVIRVGARQLQVFGTCTLLPPDGQIGGVTWVFIKKVKPWKMGKLKDTAIFSASIYENPFIPREDIAYLESIYPEDSIERRIRLNGELVESAGGARVYKNFTFSLNVREQPEIALRRPLCWIWDFNVEPMVSLICQREQELFRVYKELLIEEGSIPEMCDLFRQQHPYHMAEIWLYGDASGKDRSHHDKKTSYWLIINEMKNYPVPIKMRVPERNPSIVDRINSVNRACKNERREVELEIDISCEELIEDFEQVVSDGKGGIKKTYNKKDPYYRRTHMTDAVGYWTAFEAPIAPIGTVKESRRSVNIPKPSYQSNRLISE